MEFGVYKGSTFIDAIKTAKNKKLYQMNFYAFDSFQGLPEPQGIDAHSNQFYRGQVAFGIEDFKKKLEHSGIDVSKVHLVPGWFKDILNQEAKKRLPLKAAAVVWIDCDLYESTVPVLNWITDYLVDGSILIFDDWFFYKGNPSRGEQLAFREWLKKNPQFSASEFHKYSWHGNSFIIHRN